MTADPNAAPHDPAAARLAVLAEASRIFAEARLDLDAVLDAVTRTVGDTIGDQCVIRLVSDDGQWLTPATMYHPNPEALAVMRATLGSAPQRVDEGMLGEVMRTGAPLLIAVVVPDEARAAIKPEHRLYLDRFGMHSVLVVPVRLRGRIAGVIGIARDTPGRPYTPADRSLLVDLAARAAQAIENARLHGEVRAAAEESRRHAARLQDLAEASRAFVEAGLDAATVLDALARHLARAVGDVCVIRLVSDDGQWLVPAAMYHPDPDGSGLLRGVLAAVPHRIDEGLNGRVMANGAPLLLTSATPDELRVATKPEYAAYFDRFPVHGLLMVGMRAHGRTLGTVTLMRHTSGAPYTADDQLFLQELAGRAALAVENARLYEESGRALRLRDEFLSAVSHDLRTPLTTVRGFAQVLRRRLTKTGNDGAGWLDDGLANIESAASRMTGLVHELLDVARIQAGRPLDLTFKPADLVALTRGAVAEHARAADRHQLRIETSVPRLVGRWDAPRLERVLANLLSNALKYSPDGGVITVMVEPYEQDGHDWACLSVRDQGIGIAERDLPHIFERFFRGANARGIIDGVGIGLAGVRRIVEQHGGTVAVESKEGSGATFTLRLPCGTD